MTHSWYEDPEAIYNCFTATLARLRVYPDTWERAQTWRSEANPYQNREHIIFFIV